MDVVALHAAQPVLLDGGPVAQVGPVDRLVGAVLRPGQDPPQLQVLHLTVKRIFFILLYSEPLCVVPIPSFLYEHIQTKGIHSET